MSNYFFKGGRADHKARAFAYIRDRMPLRVTDCHRGEGAGFGWPTPPSRLVSVRQRQPGCVLRGPNRRRSSSMCEGRTRPEMAAFRLQGRAAVKMAKDIRGRE